MTETSQHWPKIIIKANSGFIESLELAKFSIKFPFVENNNLIQFLDQFIQLEKIQTRSTQVFKNSCISIFPEIKITDLLALFMVTNVQSTCLFHELEFSFQKSALWSNFKILYKIHGALTATH